MSTGSIVFYILSAAIIVFSIFSVTSRKLLRAAIYLLFVLVAVAVIYFIMDYLFLAAVQVVVYMGGVLVLIIFSILLTSHLAERLQVVPRWAMFASAIAAIAGVGVVLSVLINNTLNASDGPATAYDVTAIGTTLLSTERMGYVLPFEVISVLLLAALIAAIVIAKRPRNPKNIEK